MRLPFTRAVLIAGAIALGVPAAAVVPASAGVAPGTAVATAKVIPVPTAKFKFSSQIDPYADYNGQTLCSPVSKPGVLDLVQLLRATYGNFDAGIVRACSDGGVSEHKEGRAVDWMVSVRVPAQKAVAQAFLAWLLAPDQFGNPGAMARRLGIMYIGWDNHMWRSYDPTRGKNGWDDLKGCSTTPAMKAKSYDTYCHRNHIHLSFSWDGADAKTSFWTGRPIMTPDCELRGTAVRMPSAGTTATSALLLDTATGAGTAAGTTCRLATDRWNGDDHDLAIRVPVPAGGAYDLRVRVERFASNAPGSLVLDTGASAPVSVSASSPLPAEVLLPIAGDGVVTVSTNAGEASVRLVGLGLVAHQGTPGSSPAAAAPRVTMVWPDPVASGSSLTLTGLVSGAPAGATVQRYMQVGSTWQARGAAVTPVGGRWSMTTTAPSPQTLRYRVGLLLGGKVLDWSGKRTVLVNPAGTRPMSSFHQPASARTGTTFVMTGRVRNAPAGSTTQRYLKVGSAYQPRGVAVATAGTRSKWRVAVQAPSTAGPLVYRIAVLYRGHVIGWSRVKTVPVG